MDEYENLATVCLDAANNICCHTKPLVVSGVAKTIEWYVSDIVNLASVAGAKRLYDEAIAERDTVIGQLQETEELFNKLETERDDIKEMLDDCRAALAGSRSNVDALQKALVEDGNRLKVRYEGRTMEILRVREELAVLKLENDIDFNDEDKDYIRDRLQEGR